MRKLVMIGAVALSLCLLGMEEAWGCHRGGCGGGGGHRGHGRCGHGGCGHGGGGHCYGGGYGGGCGGGHCAGGGYGMPHHAYASEAPAYLVVNLPENAQLTVEGAATTSTSAVRTFQTPPLEYGQSYTYTLRAEVERDGVMSGVTQTVTVRAGQTTRVSLEVPAGAVASR
jgi:uncharacterized protein (TIGR03000 family)